MNPEVKKVAEGSSIGFKIAKEYFQWNKLTCVEEHYKAGQIIYLASLIDKEMVKK